MIQGDHRSVDSAYAFHVSINKAVKEDDSHISEGNHILNE